MASEESGGFLRTFMDVLYFRNPNGELILYLAIVLGSLGTLAVATALQRTAKEGALARYAARVTPAYPYILLQCGVILLISLQAMIELRFTAWLGWDFTPHVFAVEGRATEHFQRFLHEGPWGPILDSVLILVYTWGAFLLSIVPFLYLVFAGRVGSLRRLVFTLALVWAVGLVFYLFVPVYEVWVTADAPYHYTNVKNILIANSPALADAAIYQVNLNNNFPSLHTAVAVATVLSLYFAGERWAFRLGAPIACGVVVATVYLGIHWFVDLVAGVALAWGAARFVHVKESARVPVEASGGAAGLGAAQRVLQVEPSRRR